MPKSPSCNWRDGTACQFANEPQEVREIEGRHYCLMHWPIAAHTDESKARAGQWIQKLLNEAKISNFDGVTFPRATYRCRRHSTFSFRHCTFDDHCSLDFISDELKTIVRFDGSTALGPLSVLCRSVETFHFRQCELKGLLTVANDETHYRLMEADFSGSKFFDGLLLSYQKKPARLALTGCECHRAPDFRDISALPDRTFFDATFSTTAITFEDEGRYRHIRNLFHSNRAREDEGKFYALERRSNWKGLTWLPIRRGVSKLFSKLYDVFSEFGQSYERALGCLLGLQLIAACFYSLAANSVCLSRCAFDVDIVRFTVAQVVKPFEAFSARGIGGWTLAATQSEGDLSGAWLFWTTLHSVLSLVLIALFFLALRWRFRRD